MDGNTAVAIDRKSYMPAYAQLAAILRHRVASGEFRPGDQLPSESQLVERYGVSPMTVRRSINLLVDEGLVDTVQGLGTFAKPIDLGAAAFDLRDLQAALSGADVTVRVLEASIKSADERVARKLEIEKGRRVVYIRRQILQRQEPFFYHREYLVYDPRRPVVEGELEVTSLKGLFSGKGSASFKWGRLVIDPTVVNERETRYLDVPVGTAAFRLEHVFYDFEDQPLSWGWFICPLGELQLTTTVGACEQL
jgi:GntR family transcriptional regulator